MYYYYYNVTTLWLRFGFLIVQGEGTVAVWAKINALSRSGKRLGVG